MGRVAIALVLALSLSLVMAVPVAADVGAITYTDLTEPGQRIADQSDPTALFKVDITTNASHTLDKVRVEFENVSGFDQTDLDTVSVYEDDACTTLIAGSVSWVGLVATVTFDSGFVIDTITDNLWVAIATSATTANNDQFRARLGTSSLYFDDADWGGASSMTTSTITADTEDPVISVVGSTLGADKITITFSEAVVAVDEDWSDGDELEFIKTGPDIANLVDVDITDSPTFSYDAATFTLTITLDYDVDPECDYLTNGDIVAVTPLLNAIEDMSGKVVDAEQVLSGAITGDTRAPRVAPADIVGNSGATPETIVITFSEIVLADDGTWSASEVAQVRSGADAASLQALDLTDANYGIDGAELVLTIQLDSNHANLVNGNILAFTPAEGAITDLAGIPMAFEEVVGTTAIGGDDTPPTIPGAWAFTVGGEDYDPSDRALTDADTLTMTITFDEAMADSPQVSIEDADEVEILVATDMTQGVGNAWSYGFAVPAGHDGEAIITASGTDLAGNELTGTVADTFIIDNTVPSIPPANITSTVEVGDDKIIIAFSEDTRGDWTVAYADSIDKDDFASIKTGGTTLSLDNAGFVYVDTTCTLTITLDEAIDGAYLISGDTVAVTPATGALTDKAGNALAATEVVGTRAVGEAVLAEVWVDDDATPEWLTSEAHFDTIQGGIDAVAESGTVNVAPGTYKHATEDLPIEVNKAGVILQATGTAAETIIDCEGTHGGINITAADVTVDGFMVKDATGNAIRVAGANAIVKYNEIESATGYPMVYVISGATGTILSHNTLDINTTMIVSSPDISNITLLENTFGAGINLQAGIGTLEDIDITSNIIIGSECVGIKFETGSFDDILIQGNTISETTQGTDEGGIAFKDAVDTVTNVTITGNDITDNFDAGILIGDVTWGTGNAINNNNITGNDMGLAPEPDDGFGIENKTDVEVDAEDNWWGSAFESDIAEMVDGDVDYSPWLDGLYPYGKSTTTDGFTINLVAGWNLISLPLVPTSSVIADVLDELTAEGTVDEVRTYEQGWYNWASSGPAGNLTLMEDGPGYWIKMFAADALVITGTELPAPPATPKSYNVYIGWNLIGFKSLVTDVEASDYLDALGTADVLQSMYRYDAASEVYVVVQAAHLLIPGQGYWLAVSADGVIYP